MNTINESDFPVMVHQCLHPCCPQAGLGLGYCLQLSLSGSSPEDERTSSTSSSCLITAGMVLRCALFAMLKSVRDFRVHTTYSSTHVVTPGLSMHSIQKKSTISQKKRTIFEFQIWFLNSRFGLARRQIFYL